MFIKKSLSLLLCAALITASVPVSAQPRPKPIPKNDYQLNNYGFNNYQYNHNGWGNTFNSPLNPFGTTFKTKEQMDAEFAAKRKKLDERVSLAFFNPAAVYDGLNYFDALYVWKKLHPKAKDTKGFAKDVFINPAWAKYNSAIKDYRRSSYRSHTPYQVMKAMESETKTIGELLKKNPRYIKELRKAEVKEFGRSCLQGIALGLMAVAAVYTCGAAGCVGGAAWFGGTAAGGTLITATASMSLTKTIAAVVMLEIATYLGSEILDNLYDDLTDRLIKYSYISNNQYAQRLAEAAAKGAIANECTVECSVPNKPKVTPNTRWLDDIAQEEAIIRLHGLIVIKNELQYSTDSYRYDLALLDLISLFSDEQQVSFDEKVFTRTVISEGEKHYQKNSNVVDTNTGRLVRRTPELIQALKAIQNIDKESNIRLPRHPREVNGIIWPSK